MSLLLPRLILVAVLLNLLSVVPGGAHLTLPLSAALATAVLFGASRRPAPRRGAWRWAAWGSLFWTLEETLWALARSLGLSGTVLFTDVLYFVGLALWFVAVYRAPLRARPRWGLLVALPVIVYVAWGLLQNPRLAVVLHFPLLDIALVLAALPLLEPIFRGEAPEGRGLWWLGLLLRALAGALFVPLETSYNVTFFYMIWVFGYTFIAVGAFLELRDGAQGDRVDDKVNDRAGGSLLPTAYTLLSLEAVAATVLGLLYGGGRAALSAPTNVIVAALLLGYLLFVGVMLLVAADRRRRRRAEEKLRGWADLLERLIEFSPAGEDTRTVFQGLSALLKPSFPQLRGLTVHEAVPADALPDKASPKTSNKTRPGRSGGYAFPLVAGGTELGHLHFDEPPQNPEVLAALAPLVAGRVRGVLSHARSHEEALTDPLTGLLNRRGLEARASTLVALSSGGAQPLGVAMLDLDHFKRVNDAHGHATGDRVLVRMADILRRNIRSGDLAVRWGGEEFLLVLCGADAQKTEEVVTRVQAELRGERVPPVDWPLTLSAGLGGGVLEGNADGDADNSATLLRWLGEADAALYEAKRAGRDRVSVAAPAQAEGGAAREPKHLRWGEG